jgi:hypothetical protein
LEVTDVARELEPLQLRACHDVLSHHRPQSKQAN